jgi:hypothetical protein
MRRIVSWFESDCRFTPGDSGQFDNPVYVLAIAGQYQRSRGAATYYGRAYVDGVPRHVVECVMAMDFIGHLWRWGMMHTECYEVQHVGSAAGARRIDSGRVIDSVRMFATFDDNHADSLTPIGRMVRYAHTHCPILTYGAPYGLMESAMGAEALDHAFTRCFASNVRLRVID